MNLEESGSNQSENRRVLPRSEADFNMLMTDTDWGKQNISKELRDKVARYYVVQDNKGNPVLKREDLWGLLNTYTRDIRLGNLDNVELMIVRHYIKLANDLLAVDMIGSFMVALNRAINILETSQSKKGFLRKRMNTITSESYAMDEPKKNTLFGKSGGGER